MNSTDLETRKRIDAHCDEGSRLAERIRDGLNQELGMRELHPEVFDALEEQHPECKGSAEVFPEMLEIAEYAIRYWAAFKQLHGTAGARGFPVFPRQCASMISDGPALRVVRSEEEAEEAPA